MRRTKHGHLNPQQPGTVGGLVAPRGGVAKITSELELLINGKRLMRYLDWLSYPVDVYGYCSRTVEDQVNREQLVGLIEAGRVFGIGSQRRLRRLQFHEKPISLVPRSASEPDPAGRSDAWSAWRAETNFTVERQPLTCGIVYRHHPRHCEAFSPIPINRDTDPFGKLAVHGECL